MLFSNDCVIVPGFGAFIGNYIPARHDKSTDTFYPPERKISFNRNLVHNDGLIVGRLSEALGINYGDARAMVEEYSENLQKRLKRGERLAIDHLGTFWTNREGSLQFEPDRDASYYPGAYGLDSFRMAPLSEYDVRKRIMPALKPEPVRGHNLRRNLWRAAVVVPLLSAIVWVSLRQDFFGTRNHESSMNPLAREEFESNERALKEESQAEVNATVPGIAKAENEQPSAQPEVSIYPGASYSIVTGSFRSEQNALAQAAALKSKGLNPSVTVAPNGFFRVSAMKCSDIVTARTKKDSLNASFPGSWITRN